MTTPAASVEAKLNEFAEDFFERLAADFRALLPNPIQCLEAGISSTGWDALVAHFAPLGARIAAPGPSLGEEQFTFHLDQRAAYLLPGSQLEFPDPVLGDLVRQGVFNDDLQDALSEIGNNLVGTLKRGLEPIGLAQDLVRGETVWEPGLLAKADPEALRLSGLFTYRQTRLLLLLTPPSSFSAQLEAK